MTDSERRARFGNRAAVIAVDDAEAALLLERELFDRGALVAVLSTPTTTSAGAIALAKSAGIIAIITGEAGAGVIDGRRLATNEAIGVLERKGVLVGHEEQLLEGEGI